MPHLPRGSGAVRERETAAAATARANGYARGGLTPRAAYPCDLCHWVRGVRMTDTFWTCAECAETYLTNLERERYADAAIWHGPWGIRE